MKNLTLDIKAALLYLACYQWMENDNSNPDDLAQELVQEITWLVTNGYPDPTTIVYDNGGIPQIEWKFPTFEAETFYEAIDYDTSWLFKLP